jgi:hypothetical protein
MEMVSKDSAPTFKQGDLVKWWYSAPTIPHTVDKNDMEAWVDIGIVLTVEKWAGDDDIRSVIEVYFAKAGPNWCNPKSLELVNRY